jgi:hypothetical protein
MNFNIILRFFALFMLLSLCASEVALATKYSDDKLKLLPQKILDLIVTNLDLKEQSRLARTSHHAAPLVKQAARTELVELFGTYDDKINSESRALATDRVVRSGIALINILVDLAEMLRCPAEGVPLPEQLPGDFFVDNPKHVHVPARANLRNSLLKRVREQILSNPSDSWAGGFLVGLDRYLEGGSLAANPSMEKALLAFRALSNAESKRTVDVFFEELRFWIDFLFPEVREGKSASMSPEKMSDFSTNVAGHVMYGQISEKVKKRTIEQLIAARELIASLGVAGQSLDAKLEIIDKLAKSPYASFRKIAVDIYALQLAEAISDEKKHFFATKAASCYETLTYSAAYMFDIHDYRSAAFASFYLGWTTTIQQEKSRHYMAAAALHEKVLAFPGGAPTIEDRRRTVNALRNAAKASARADVQVVLLKRAEELTRDVLKFSEHNSDDKYVAALIHFKLAKTDSKKWQRFKHLGRAVVPYIRSLVAIKR